MKPALASVCHSRLPVSAAIAVILLEEKDRATHAFLQWFMTEQVEEEASTEDIVHKLKMVGNSTQGMLMLDSQLGQRTDEGQ